jgi:excisionase family DNA binding protein
VNSEQFTVYSIQHSIFNIQYSTPKFTIFQDFSGKLGTHGIPLPAWCAPLKTAGGFAMSIFIKVKEVAQILGVSRFRVYALMDRGILPSVRPYGGKRKILRKDFEAWLQRVQEGQTHAERKS